MFFTLKLLAIMIMVSALFGCAEPPSDAQVSSFSAACVAAGKVPAIFYNGSTTKMECVDK